MTTKSFDDSASKIAEFLLQIKAIKLQPENPFTHGPVDGNHLYTVIIVKRYHIHKFVRLYVNNL
jgi:hypothetical protein